VKYLYIISIIILLASCPTAKQADDYFFSAFDTKSNVTPYCGGYVGDITFSTKINCLNDTIPEDADVFYGDLINITLFLTDDLMTSKEQIKSDTFLYEPGCIKFYTVSKSVNFSNMQTVNPVRLQVCMKQDISRVWKCKDSRFLPSVVINSTLTNSTVIVNMSSHSTREWGMLMGFYGFAILMLIAGVILAVKLHKLQLGFFLFIFGIVFLIGDILLL